MASVRNGVILLVALAACFASAVTAEIYDCSAPATDDCEWDCYINHESNRQTSVQSQSIEDADDTMSASPAKGYTITVDSKGKGNFKTIQAAINSIPDGNTRRITIQINDGVFRYDHPGRYKSAAGFGTSFLVG